MKRILFGLAVAGLFGGVALLSHPPLAKAASGGADEYAIIQWDGPRNTQVIWSDGHIELLPQFAPEAMAPPDHAHQRGYVTTIMMNKLAKQGYEYIGMADGEEIVMKKVR